MQPNVKPQPEEDGGESVSSPTMTTTGVSNVQVGSSLAPCLSPHHLPFPLPSASPFIPSFPFTPVHALRAKSSQFYVDKRSPGAFCKL